MSKYGSALLSWNADGTSIVNPDTMKKGGKVKKQKQMQKQMQVVNVTVNAVEKKAKQRRRAPRAKKAVAGDSIMLQRGDVPKPHHGYAPHGEPMRLAGPGQNYASLPAPLQRSSYASIPSVMNPQASPAFVSSADMMYGRNRNKNDDIKEVVNPSDITPMAKPSKRMSASQTPPGAGFIPSASSKEEARSVEPASFQGIIPRLNVPDESPSMHALPSAPSAGAVLQGNMSYPGFPLQEELDEMAAEMEEDAGEFTSAAVSAFEPADRRTIKRPVRVDVGGEASGGSRTAMEVYGALNVDNITNKDTLRSMLLTLGKGQPGVGDVSNLKRDSYWNGPGMIDRLRESIKLLQKGRPLPPRGKEAAMRRGGSVF